MVVVIETTGVDGVCRLGSDFWNLSEMEKSCVECLWRVPKNAKVYFMYRRCSLMKDFFAQTHAASFTPQSNQFSLLSSWLHH